MKNIALLMMLISKENMRMSKVSRFLRQSLYKAKSWVRPNIDGGLFLLVACHKHIFHTTIMDKKKELVYIFWKDETRVLPNKKDVCQKRLGRESYIKHPAMLEGRHAW